MDCTLKKCKLLRAPVRAKLTKLTKSAEEVINGDGEERSAEILLMRLKNTLSDLKELDTAVVDRMVELNSEDESYDEALEEEINRNAEISDEMEDLMAALSLKVSTNNGDPVKPDPEPRAMLKGPKMPSIKIPKFSGDILSWQTFWDTFRANVHENAQYAKVAKMACLKEHVVGEAADALQHLYITDGCYDQAIELLRLRFGREQDVKFAHMLELLNMKPASNLTELRSVIDKAEGHLRCLTAMGLSERDNAELFTCVLLSKIPERTRADFTRRKGATDWSLALLRDMLADEVRALDSFKLTSSKGRQRDEKRPYPGGRPSTTQALLSPHRTRSCAFCQKDHFSDQCKNFQTLEERKGALGDSCFKCFKRTHRVKECQSKGKCFYCKRQSHHSALCPEKFGHEKIWKEEMKMEHVHVVPHKDKPESREPARAVSLLPLATAPVKGENSPHTKELRMILDVASGRSYITERAAAKLKLKPHCYEVLTYASFGSGNSTTRRVPIANLEIQTTDGCWLNLGATIVPTITTSVVKHRIDPEDYPVLRSVRLAEPLCETEEICDLDLLIGLDHYFQVVLKERIDLGPSLVLMNTRLGWVPAGAIGKRLDANPIATLISKATNETVLLSPNSGNLLQSEEELWSLDAIGIKECGRTSDDDLAISQFNQSIKSVNGRYYVSWPWRSSSPNELKTNFGLAYGRLKSLLKQLKDRPEILVNYDKVIKQQEELGVVEKIDELDDVNPRTGDNGQKIHYLPHHAVFKSQSSTTKLRIVFDASAKSKQADLSLNDCLLKGPTSLQDLPGILHRFRLNEVALIADIEKAFLQIGLHPSDKDVCRFLWLEDPTSHDLRNITTYRFRRVPFGIISSPFLLNATIKHHIQAADSPFAEEILSNTYVDNLVTGQASVEAALEFFSGVKNLFQSANMTLREWGSNSTEVLTRIPSEDRISEDTAKVLGLSWDTKQDVLSYPHQMKEEFVSVTKRVILQLASKVFDPLGLSSPVTVSAKMLIQDLWKAKHEWDDPDISSDLKSQWQQIYRNLIQLNEIRFPRLVKCKNEVTELHIFADASKRAYGACAYFRVVKEDESIETNLVFARTRVAPLKELTLPRLELMAALVGARLAKYLIRESRLCFSKLTLWSDAKCVLYWIKGRQLKPVFVENRLREIRSVQFNEFRYIASEDNPADLLSRGIDTQDMKQNSLWWKGPSWLSQTSGWPATLTFQEPPQEEEPDHCNTEVLIVNEKEKKTPFNIKAEEFSSLNRLLQVTAWCIRAVKNFKKEDVSKSGFITAPEKKNALQTWVKSAQANEFADLKRDLQQRRSSELIRQLKLFEDEQGFIRCGGRLENSEFDEMAKHPILLPKNNALSSLIILDFHQQTLHSGTQQTLSALRQHFWIPAGRSQVQKQIRRCVICRRSEGEPFLAPPEPPLPEGRVSRNLPFSVTGVDYLGPCFVRDDSSATTRKVWICLFTCAAVRAVHLEVVESLTTEDFIYCLRRFFATRGVPSVIISDNAKHFIQTSSSVERVWSKITGKADLQTYVAQKGIQWKFITPRAPWMGGFYERLVGSVKRTLKKVLGRTLVSLTQLQTLLKEIQAILNTRPLTYVGSEFDGKNCLTPSDLIGERPSYAEITENVESQRPSTTRCDVISLWKKGQRILEAFWKTWKKDYLLSLRERHPAKTRKKSAKTTPKVDQIVLLKDTQLPRGRWKLVRIAKLHPSADNLIRSADVLTSSGKRLKRPIQHLIPLEFEVDVEGREAPRNPVAQSSVPFPRPPRITKTKALDLMNSS